MVEQLVSQFLSGLEDDGPLLEVETLSPRQLTSAATYDIESGILNTKDFPDNLDLTQMYAEFRSAYTNIIRAVRVSAEGVLQSISRQTDAIPAFYPSDVVTFGTVTQITPILQMVETGYLETNAAHINLERVLSRIRGDLVRLGGGLPTTIDPNLTRIANLANTLERSAADRDSILSLFQMRIPADRVSRPLAVLLPERDRNPNSMSRLAALTTTAGRTQRRDYGVAIIMMIRAHQLAIEAIQTYYEIGGRNIELATSIGGTDSLPSLETAVASSHDHLRTNVSRILNGIVANPAFVASTGLTPAQVAQIQNLANDVNSAILDTRIRGRANRETLFNQQTEAEAILRHATAAFEIIANP